MKTRMIIVIGCIMMAVLCFIKLCNSYHFNDIRFVKGYLEEVAKNDRSVDEIVNEFYSFKYSDIEGKEYADVIKSLHSRIIAQGEENEIMVSLYDKDQFDLGNSCDISKDVTGSVLLMTLGDDQFPVLIKNERIVSLLPICKGENVRWW